MTSMIVYIAVGAIAVLAIVLMTLFILIRRKKQDNTETLTLEEKKSQLIQEHVSKYKKIERKPNVSNMLTGLGKEVNKDYETAKKESKVKPLKLTKERVTKKTVIPARKKTPKKIILSDSLITGEEKTSENIHKDTKDKVPVVGHTAKKKKSAGKVQQTKTAASTTNAAAKRKKKTAKKSAKKTTKKATSKSAKKTSTKASAAKKKSTAKKTTHTRKKAAKKSSKK